MCSYSDKRLEVPPGEELGDMLLYFVKINKRKETSAKLGVGKVCRESSHAPSLTYCQLFQTGRFHLPQQEDVTYSPQWEGWYLALPSRKCNYFTCPVGGRKSSFSPSNKCSQWKHCSSVNEKLFSPELLLSSSELSFLSFFLTDDFLVPKACYMYLPGAPICLPDETLPDSWVI